MELEHENPYTESRIAISLWQISKLVPEEIVSQVGSVDLLCKILEMKKKGWLEEVRDGVYAIILTDDKDSRCFSMTFRRYATVSQRDSTSGPETSQSEDEEKIEQKIKNSTTKIEAKMRIRGLKT